MTSSCSCLSRHEEKVRFQVCSYSTSSRYLRKGLKQPKGIKKPKTKFGILTQTLKKMLNVIWWKFGTFPNFWPQKDFELWAFISFHFHFHSYFLHRTFPGKIKKPLKKFGMARLWSVGRPDVRRAWKGEAASASLKFIIAFLFIKRFLFKIGVWLPHIHSRQLIHYITLSYVIYNFTPKWLFKYVSIEILPNKRSLPPLGLEPMTNIISPGHYLLYRIYAS